MWNIDMYFPYFITNMCSGWDIYDVSVILIQIKLSRLPVLLIYY